MTAAKEIIREMLETDIRSVLEIERVSFPTPWTEAMFRRQLLLGDIAVNLVSVVEERIVGYAAAWVVCDEVHILSIAVAPADRRSGYAAGLLDELIRRGSERGGTRVVLEVRTRNTAARRFYERHGFSVIGIRRRYYMDTGDDAVVMERGIER